MELLEAELVWHQLAIFVGEHQIEAVDVDIDRCVKCDLTAPWSLVEFWDGPCHMI